MEPLPPELNLLLLCAQTRTSTATDARICQGLGDNLNWKLFAELAKRHGLAGLAGETLHRVAANGVPTEILEELPAITGQRRRRATSLLDGLGQVLELLRSEGIEAIAFSGPVLGLRAYGDVALRPFGHLDLLVRDSDMNATISILRGRGYESGNCLTEAQSQLIRRLEGREQLASKDAGTNLWVHTRLTPLSWAVDIDHPALWRRAERATFNGREFLTLCPEDELINSAINRGRSGWRTLKPFCDVAALLQSNPLLDWAEAMELARKQGCRRRLLAAVTLARKYFGARIPEWVAAAADSDLVLQRLEKRIAASWWACESEGSKNGRDGSIVTWQLHDGPVQRIRYISSWLFLPKPHHVAAVSLPRKLVFAYPAVKFIYDAVGLVTKPYRRLRSRFGESKNSVAASHFGLGLGL